MYLAKIHTDYPAGTIIEYKAPFDKETCQKYGILPTHPMLIIGRERVPYRGYQCMCISTNIRHFTGYLIDLCDQANTMGWNKRCQASVIGTSQVYTIDIKQVGKVLGFVPPELLKAVREAYAYEIGLTDVVPPCRVDIYDKPSIVANECIVKGDERRVSFVRVNDHIYKEGSPEIPSEDQSETNEQDNAAPKEYTIPATSSPVVMKPVDDTSAKAKEAIKEVIDDALTPNKSAINCFSDSSFDDGIDTVKSSDKRTYRNLYNVFLTTKFEKVSQTIETAADAITEEDVFKIVTGLISGRDMVKLGYGSVATCYRIRNVLIRRVQKAIPKTDSSRFLAMKYKGGNVYDRVAIRVLVPEWFAFNKSDINAYKHYFDAQKVDTVIKILGRIQK